MITFLQIIHLLVSIALIGVILMQAGKGHGLSGAFGSFAGNSVQNIFGARTTDALTRLTMYLSIAFMVLAIILAIMQGHKSESSVMKNYTSTKALSESPSESAENVAQKISEMTDKLLKKSEQTKEEIPSEIEPSIESTSEESPEMTDTPVESETPVTEEKTPTE